MTAFGQLSSILLISTYSFSVLSSLAFVLKKSKTIKKSQTCKAMVQSLQKQYLVSITGKVLFFFYSYNKVYVVFKQENHSIRSLWQ